MAPVKTAVKEETVKEEIKEETVKGALKEGTVKVTVKEEKVPNVIDVFWDGWFNSFKTFQSFQSGVEKYSLQAVESQKGWIHLYNDHLTQLEEGSKKLTAQWFTAVQDAFKKAQAVYSVPSLTDWAEKLQEVGNTAETFSFNPGKATLELLSQSHAQLETAIQKAIEQQEKNRAEVLNAIGEYVEQLKQAQNGLLKTFADNSFIAK